MNKINFTLDDLKRIIFNLMDVDPQSNMLNINKSSHFIEDIGMSSLALVSMVFVIEDELSIDLSEKAEDIANLKTVGETLNYLQALI